MGRLPGVDTAARNDSPAPHHTPAPNHTRAAAPAGAHQRPAAAGDATVRGVGRLTEALEWVERARGDLYEFHQKMGHADAVLQQAVRALEEAGHGDDAAALRSDLVGRDVLPGRWTYQIVEEFDDGYWEAFRAAELAVRERLVGGRRPVLEAEMKAEEQAPA